MPMPDQILSELRALRDDLGEHSERLTAIEVLLHTVVGNGQPGRLAKVEERIGQLESFRFWLLGAASAIGAVSSLLLHFLVK